MIDINRAMKSRRLMRSLTGLDKKKFNNLLKDFTRVYKKQKMRVRVNRQRADGGGRKHTLMQTKELLFFILFYMKVYPTFDLAGFIFNVDKSQTNRWVHKLLPILEEALRQKVLLPKRKIKDADEFISHFPGVKDLFIDVTERPVQRKKRDKHQKREYSGKKKRHTRQSTVAVDENKNILYVYKVRPGKQHDKKIFEKSDLPYVIPKGVTLWVDLGYQGIKNHTSLDVMMPHKKPKGKKLTDEQKAENRIISSLRMVVENSIGGVKRYGSVANIYRNKIADTDNKIFDIACGLWNLHISEAA